MLLVSLSEAENLKKSSTATSVKCGLAALICEISGLGSTNRVRAAAFPRQRVCRLWIHSVHAKLVARFDR